MSAPTVGALPPPPGPGLKVTVVVPVGSVATLHVKPRAERVVRVGAVVAAAGAGHAAGRQLAPMREASMQTPSHTTKPVGQVPGGGSNVADPPGPEDTTVPALAPPAVPVVAPPAPVVLETPLPVPSPLVAVWPPTVEPEPSGPPPLLLVVEPPPPAP